MNLQDLLDFLDEQPTADQQEMQYYIYDEWGVEIGQSTISRCLKRLRWSRKKVGNMPFLHSVQ